jgi:hypothetical protein
MALPRPDDVVALAEEFTRRFHAGQVDPEQRARYHDALIRLFRANLR